MNPILTPAGHVVGYVTIAPRTRTRPGWRRLSAPGDKCGAYWEHVSGGTVRHCGHPTALYGYEAHGPDGEPLPAANGRWHSTLIGAMAAVEGAGRCPPPPDCLPPARPPTPWACRPGPSAGGCASASSTPTPSCRAGNTAGRPRPCPNSWRPSAPDAVPSARQHRSGVPHYEETMKKRKTRHAGVYRLGDGRWRVVSVIRLPDGGQSRRERTLPSDTTEAAAVMARATLALEHRRDLEEGPPPAEPAPETITVASYCRSWTKRKIAGREWRGKTARENARDLEEFVLPRLGHLDLRTLTRADVLDWRSWAQTRTREDGEPYARATMDRWWRHLRAMLNDAIAEYELPVSLTWRIKPPVSPRAGVRESRALTAKQLGRVLERVRTHRPEWYAEVALMAWTGLRPSELYALTRADVDLDGGYIAITKGVVAGVVGPPKAGERVVALDGELVAILRDHLDDRPGLPGALVFPSATGTYRHEPALYKVLRTVGDDLGLPVRVGPQVLRYTANTLMREAGVPDAVVRDRLGHATVEMGLHYYRGHLSAQVEAVGAMRRLLLSNVAAGAEGGAEDPGSNATIANESAEMQ